MFGRSWSCHAREHPREIRVFLLQNHRGYIGWASASTYVFFDLDIESNYIEFMLNIRPKYRRRGYGRILTKVVKDYAKQIGRSKIRCYAHDSLSIEFFGLWD